MSDENTVGLQTDPNDISNIEKLTAAVLKLDQSLGHLATNNGGLSDLKSMMVSMQSTMITGFTEMAALAAKSGEKLVSDRKKSGEQMVAEEEKAWEKMFFTSQAALSRIELSEEAAAARRLARAAAVVEKQLTLEIASENQRAAALQAIIERRDVWEMESRARTAAADAAAADRRLNQEITSENQRAAALQAAMQKQDLWMAEERGRQLELEQLFQDKRTAIQLGAAEKQRVLNTSFITSPISSQISTAERAAVYSNLGGNSVQRFGSEAATADLAGLRAQYAAMPAVTRAATEGVTLHNAAMAEGHALARGLSGSLGALWLTYGSLVPLAAGAAIGASLKNIAEAGKEVEYSLKFVEALGGSAVKMDDFLRVTDGTVVSIKEAAEGMRALAQNGLNAVQSLQILPTILNLSVIGEMSVNAAALSATGVISAFGLQLGDAARVGDVFAQAAASSNTSVALMTESMKQASTVASLYHVTLEETAAGLGELAKINITGSAAGTAFTNMLTGLYAPTAKAQKALELLKVTTDDGQGGLKNSTQLLGELRVALSQYDEKAQTVFLNDIFTTRGTKAATTLLNNLDEYKQRIDEAVNSTGFMSAAVAKLEDTTQGAFQRMKNEIGDSLNRAFASSSPGLQRLITDLGTLAGSTAAVQTLTAIADAALRVTNLFVDHAKAIAAAAAMYGVFKVASAVAASLTAVETGLLATSVAAKALAADIALVTASLGVIALAIGAAVLVWTLFVDKTSDVEKANLKIQNSIDTNIEFINRETRALEERNKAWNPVTQKFDLAPEKQLDMSAAQTAVKRAEEMLAMQPAGPKGLGDQTWYDNREKGLQQLAAAQAELHAQEMAGAFLAEQLEDEKARKEKANVITQLEALVKKGETEKRINGELVAVDALGNERSRAVTQEAAATLKQLLDNTLSTKQAQIELTAESRKYNAELKEAPPKADKKGDNDRLAAAIAEVAMAKELLKVRQQTAELDLKKQVTAGSLGDLGYLQAHNALQQESVAATLKQAQADIALVAGAENKRAATQKYQNQLAVGREQAKQDALQAMIGADAAIETLRTANLKVEADNYTKRGELLDAFLTKYEADNARAIAKVTADQLLVVSALAGAADDPFADPENTARLRAYNDAFTTYLNNQKKAKEEGTNSAIFQQTKQQLDGLLSTLQSSLATAKTAGNEEGGLSGALGVGAAAANLRDNLLPQITDLQKQLSNIAQGTPALEKLATDSSKRVAGDTLSLNKAAQPFGDAWTEIWKKVEQGGHDTWLSLGKGGTDTLKKLGDTLKSSILEMLYQLTVKKWIINIGASISNSLFGSGDAASAAANAATSAAGGGGNTNSLVSAANTANSLYKLTSGGGIAANVGSGISSFGGFVGSSTIAEFGSGFGGSAAAAAEALGAEMTTAASAGAAFSSALATAVPWIAAAVIAYKAFEYFFEDGPEQNTRLTFASNNRAGNISINERGNEGRSSSYIDTPGTGAFGTFGVSRSLWSPSDSAAITAFITNVTKADDVFSRYLTTAETAAVKSGVTGQDFTAQFGAEGSDQNAVGADGTSALDKVFSSRLHVIFESVEAGLSGLLDGAKGTAKELADEGSAILAFRAGLTASMQTVYGASVTLQQLAALKTPTESVSAALNRVQADFQATNQVALALGKTTAEAFGAVGLASYSVREQLITAAGGASALTSSLSGFAKNYFSSAEQLAPVSKALDAALSSLSLKSIPTTRDEFKALVQGLDLTDAAQQKTFVSLMALQDVFAQVHEASNSLIDPLKAQTDLLALQAQVYEETGNQAGAAEVLSKQHAMALKGLTPAMADLTQQLWAAQAATKAAAEASALLDIQAQLYAETGDKAAAAAVLEKQHQTALAGMSDETAKWTQQLWAAQDAAKSSAAAAELLDVQAQLYDTLGDKAAAAAVLEKQHQAALAGMSEETAKWTQQLWAAQAAQAGLTERKGIQDELDTYMRPEDRVAKQRAALDPGNRNLFDQLQAHKAIDEAYKAETKSIKEAIESTKTFAKSLTDYKRTLVLGDTSPLTPQEKYLEAKSEFEKTFKAALGGDAAAQANFTNVADAFLSASKTANASSNQFVQDFQEVKNATERASVWAQAQIDTQQASLVALNKQVEGLAQIDASVKSVSAAIAALAAVGGDIGDYNRESSIEELYKSILGRHSDPGGMEFWKARAAEGISLSVIAESFRTSAEYLQSHSASGTADGRTVGTNRTVLRGNIVSDPSDAMAAQLAALTQAMAEQSKQTQDLMKQLATMQAQTAYQAAQDAAAVAAKASEDAADKIVNANQTKVPPK